MRRRCVVRSEGDPQTVACSDLYMRTRIGIRGYAGFLNAWNLLSHKAEMPRFTLSAI
jgi:hypothetical protein